MRGFLIWVLVCLGLGAAEVQAPVAARPRVLITTSMGAITCELFADQCPLTVANFIALAEGERAFRDITTGVSVERPFYDGLIFHRVIQGFMIQGGCPIGKGTGDPGYAIPDEINARSLGLEAEMVFVEGRPNPNCAYMGEQIQREILGPRLAAKGLGPDSDPTALEAAFAIELEALKRMNLRQLYEALGYRYRDDLPASSRLDRGRLAMANHGPSSGGSQFFITLGDIPYLAGKHSVFGQVVAGMEVVEAIGRVQTGAQDKPLSPVVIESIRRLE
jgi:peptidyl-prolyl cis-trans isomerase A (cyclophilin A)